MSISKQAINVPAPALATADDFQVLLRVKKGPLHLHNTTQSIATAHIWYREMLEQQMELDEESFVAMMHNGCFMKGCESLIYLDKDEQLIVNFVMHKTLSPDVLARTQQIWDGGNWSWSSQS